MLDTSITEAISIKLHNVRQKRHFDLFTVRISLNCNSQIVLSYYFARICGQIQTFDIDDEVK